MVKLGNIKTVLFLVSFCCTSMGWSHAHAITCDEISDLALKVQTHELSRVDKYCSSSQSNPGDCARAAEALVCSASAVSILAGDRGEACFKQNAAIINILFDELAYYNDRFKNLVKDGIMTNPVDLSPQKQRAYCNKIGATVSP